MKKITGTTQKKKDRPYWYMVLNYQDEAGKRKLKWESTKLENNKKNEKLAQEMLKQRLEELNSHVGAVVDVNTTIAELTDIWLSNVKSTVRINTYERYQLNTKKIKNYYEKRKIKVVDYSRSQAREFINYLTKEGKINQKTKKKEPLATTSVRDVVSVLTMILEEAVEHDMINHNPVKGIKIPKQKKKKDEKYLTQEEALRFIAMCKEQDDPLTDLIVAAISFGLRRSEILGLKWENINLPQRYISITTTITATTSLHIENNTKNDASARQILITNEEADFFYKIIEKQKNNEKSYGVLYSHNDYVFKWPDGRQFSPDYVTKHTKLLMRQFGEPELHFHSFRHSYASMLYAQGVPLLEAQRLLGHTIGSDTTLGIYTHIDRDAQKVRSVGIIGEIK